MKNYIFLFIFSIILFAPNKACSQSKIIMGGGVISSSVQTSTNSIWQEGEQPPLKPFVGFTYEHNFNKNLFLSANMNYSKKEIDFINNTPLDFFIIPKTKFVHISLGTLINYKVFSSISKNKFLQGFNTGIGFNIDHLTDFKQDVIGITNLDSLENDSLFQLGLLCHLSWDYKKFRLSYNFANGVNMFNNNSNIVTSIDWQTLSASYIYTLTD